jgi:transmembrane 9 superfamily protein 2/4
MLLAIILPRAGALYLPGTIPNDFKPGDKISLVTNSLRSSIRPIPFAYNKNDVFCSSSNQTDLRTNIGEFMSGDSIRVSPITFTIGESLSCVSICSKTYNETQKHYLLKLIEHRYRFLFSVDGIPASSYSNATSTTSPGVEIGFIENGQHFLLNHIDFRVKLYPSGPALKETDYSRIVGLDARARSVGPSCSSSGIQSIEASESLQFSYSVSYVTSDVPWHKRWDSILTIDYHPKVHWVSISNTLLIVMCFCILTAVLLIQTLRADFSKNSQPYETLDPLEVTGWKLIHGDVFRPPTQANILCAVVGSGIQGCLAFVIVVTVAALGFLAPLNTGSMVTAIVVIFIVVAPLGGFVSAKLFTTIGRDSRRSNFLLSSTCFIGPSLVLYLIGNVIFVKNDSAAAITVYSFWELFGIVVVLDLCLFGIGWVIGLRLGPFECPSRVNMIPRVIPDQPRFLSGFFTSLVGGFVVFASISVQVYFIFQALWTNLSYYYLFGLLLLVVMAMILISAQMAIFVVYLLMCYENHKWWWAAFRVPASVGLFTMGYCIYFMCRVYHPADFASVCIFLLVSAGISLALALINGSIGFLSAFTFVQLIFGSLKEE